MNMFSKTFCFWRVDSSYAYKSTNLTTFFKGPKIERGGSAFEVRLGPLQPLEPLAPVRRPPPRLERLKSAKKLVTKDELEEKMKQAEERRKVGWLLIKFSLVVKGLL